MLSLSYMFGIRVGEDSSEIGCTVNIRTGKGIFLNFDPLQVNYFSFVFGLIFFSFPILLSMFQGVKFNKVFPLFL